MRLRWHMIKDVSRGHFEGVRNHLNEGKVAFVGRDTQEVAPEAGFEEPDVPDIEDFDGLHEEACARGDNFYIDPKSGYMVMTRVKHEARGRCCGSGSTACRESGRS